MSRPRTPTATLERRGAFRHDPARLQARANEPVPEGPLGDPPAYFGEDLGAIWTELAETCPAGVLTSADRLIVELACQLLLKLRTGSAPGLSPKPGLSGAEIAQTVAVLSRLGMTPADRSKVGVSSNDNANDPTVDPWDQFAGDFSTQQ